MSTDAPRPPADAGPLHLDDLAVGQRFTTGALTVDEAALRAFAREFDPQPFHLDADAAGRSIFGGLVASGWHTAALTMRLLVDGGLPVAGGLIGVAAEIRWPAPARPGDTLQVHVEVLEVSPSRSRPDRGTARVRCETKTPDGETVQVLVATLVVPRRIDT